MEFIDLRSDTVTKPSAGMRDAMAKAEVGDDVFGEDPTVNKLQQKVAELLGKKAALYVPSGVMGNEICIKVHTQPGDEVIVEKGSHVFNYETGGMAFLSNVQVNAIEGHYGAFTVKDVKRVIRPKAYFMPRTTLICMENTHMGGGTILPIEIIKEMSTFAKDESLRFHLDGARLWNACAETGITPKHYASYFDSVSVSLSKGLGAPVGSVVVGSAEFITEARRYRKLFGGGMRQVGILAAAGIYALDHNLDRIKEDHTNATYLANELATIPGFDIDMKSVQTNIIIISLDKFSKTPDEVLSILKSKGILLTPVHYTSIRAVTHMDVSAEQVKQAAHIIKQTFN